jgi:hypothetical protein
MASKCAKKSHPPPMPQQSLVAAAHAPWTHSPSHLHVPQAHSLKRMQPPRLLLQRMLCEPGLLMGRRQRAARGTLGVCGGKHVAL